MPLTIIFNGTSDTYYKDDRSYLQTNQLSSINEGSHTLSFFADCIATPTEQISEPLLSKVRDPGILIQNNDLVVIQGPDDTGTGVHNLIVTGMMAALNALMRGEQEINFVGFSRGSVEAIHMTHELQRIKNYLSDSNNDHSPEALTQFIAEHCFNPGTNRFTTWRTNRVNTLYRTALLAALQEPNALENLKNGLTHFENQLRFNGMLLDPVPGFAEGTTLPSYVPWVSSHHTTIAPMVDDLTVTYMTDELSVGFRAVWVEPSPESSTKITHLHLPGYHGTANGNPVNHTPESALAQKPNPFPYQNLRAVQKLYFYKLLQFAAKHNVKFKSPAEVSDRFLTSVYTHFFNNRDNISAQNEYIRTLYKEISTHLSDYRKTRETCYLPNVLGLGGIEVANGERIVMTKSGPRSLADCFSFDISGASTYINFDSFSLDFMTLLFPEFTTPSVDSPNEQTLTYSGIHQLVTDRYSSPSPEMDCNALIKKIKGLLAACESHNLTDNLNQIILNQSLDRNGILANLVKLVPTKLADTFFSSNLSAEDKAQLQEIMTRIIRFELPALGEEENSADHQRLVASKVAYIKTLQENMQAALVNQTRKTLATLLEGQEQLQYQGHYPQLEQNQASETELQSIADHQSEESHLNVWDYLEQAEEYYHILQEVKDKLSFSAVYLSQKEYQFLHYKIEEAIAQFPLSCERVLINHEVDWQDEMANLSVLQPLHDKLVQGAELFQLRRLKQDQEALLEQLITSENALALSQMVYEDMRSQIFALEQRLDSLQTANQGTKQNLAKTQEEKEAINVALLSVRTQLETVKKQIQNTKKTNKEKNKLLSSLQGQIQTIQTTLRSQHPSDYAGFTLKVLGCLGMILGIIIATLAASYLILGTAGVATPMVGILGGSALATWGVFNFTKGTQRQRDQQLAEAFFSVPG